MKIKIFQSNSNHHGDRKVLPSISSVTKAKWDSMTNAEKKAYVKGNPTSKYAKLINPTKTGREKTRSANINRKINSRNISYEYELYDISWDGAKATKEAHDVIKQFNLQNKTKIKVDKVVKYEFDAPDVIISGSYEDMRKWALSYFRNNETKLRSRNPLLAKK